MSTSRPAHAHQSHLLARRALESGWQKSWRYCKEQAWNNIARRLPIRGADMEISIAQQIIDAAVKSYRPETYKATCSSCPLRPPRRDFLPGWQTVVAEGLHTHYIQAHDRDLVEPQHVRKIADAITQLIASQ